MALAAAAASIAGGAQTLFNYNRQNFKYDREMRQECEFKILDFRKRQAGMWRQDVRDLIGLTESRMDTYLIINTLQLGMVLTIFTEGRLEAGTPQWLLRFYTLCLSSSFMYLLMSAWLAMHASVVAQTSGTRLLTQFVRLPIPTWKHIDKMRTYAASFETLGANMVRVPFMKSPDAPSSTWNKDDPKVWASSSSKNSGKPHSASRGLEKGILGQGSDTPAPREARASETGSDDNHFDVWGLETDGHEIPELEACAPADRPHISKIREDALHWQSHDIFARVNMTFGTSNFIFAIIYYCLGYISIQDGAPMPSWCVVALLLCTAVTLVLMDFVLSPAEMFLMMALTVTGPCCVALTTFLMAVRSPHVSIAYRVCLPIAYLGHAAWLFFAMKALGMKKHSNGAWLPMKFRPMTYMDVFGWYFHQIVTRHAGPNEKDVGIVGVEEKVLDRNSTCNGFGKEGTDSSRVDDKDPAWVRMKGHTDLGVEVPYLYNTQTGDIRSPSFDQLARPGTGEASSNVAKERTPFVRAEGSPAAGPTKTSEVTSLANDTFHGPATDYGKVEPGLVPWQMVRAATWLLIVLWFTGPLLSFDWVGGPLENGMSPLEFEDSVEADTDRTVRWNPLQKISAIAAIATGTQGGLPFLADGKQIEATWPRRNSFMPRSLSSDPSGRLLVVADDFGVYESALQVEPELKVSFSRAPPCTVFEGQLLKDIGVVCLRGTAECRVLVLHDNGHRISECPLHSLQKEESASSGIRGLRDTQHLNPAKSKVTPIVTWKIAAQWLNAKHEQLVSMAVNKYNSHCLANASSAHSRSQGDSTSAHAFLPNAPGCIVVGTTSGRIIGLRRHVTETRELVPEISMKHRHTAIVQGSLRIVFNGLILALRQKRKTLQALSIKSGRSLGEWRLPFGISWISLCGAGKNVFVLGRNQRGKVWSAFNGKERRVVLWRFPLPAEVLDVQGTLSDGYGGQEI